MTTNPASQLLETGITLAILPGITAAIDSVLGSPAGPPDPEASGGWRCDQISSADKPDGANGQGYCKVAW